MTEQTWFLIAMIIYLFIMLLIGMWSYTKTDEYEDYMLGGRGLHPFVAALSAGASDMSGWLLMGLPGAIYLTGYSTLWMALGLLVGCWLNWKYTAPRLRSYTEVANNSITVPSFLENRLGDKSHLLRIIASLIILFFFIFYVASGMVAGGRYFESTFNSTYYTGMIIIAAVTVAYTFVGGFLAVSYTDTVQGCIMFFSLLIVPIIAIFSMNNPGDILSWPLERSYGLESIPANPDFYSLISGVGIIAIISNLAWGFGYFGQPHIIVRFMAMRSARDAVAGRRYGVSWMFLCLLGAVAVATIGPAFFGSDPHIAITDQENFETIFLDMGRILFHPLIAGLVLTAVLAAIMSTISSQLLVVASALVEDIYAGLFNKKASDSSLQNLSRLAVILVALIAAVIAWNPEAGVLKLVEFAWAGFGASFGPLIVATLYWRRLNAPGAIAGLAAGAITVFFWGGLPQFGVYDKPFGLYEMVPGLIVNIIVMVSVTLTTPKPSSHTTATFDEAVALSKA